MVAKIENTEEVKKLCDWKGVEIIEGEIYIDHVHLLLSIPLKMSVSGFMGYLKGKNSLMLFQRFGNMIFAYRNREFWCRGNYVDTVGKKHKNDKRICNESIKGRQRKRSNEFI